MRLSSILIVLALTAGTSLSAGNIQVSNVSLGNQNLTNKTYKVIFDISWENSWRTSTFESNYDAAWIFIKWRLNENQIWSHANVKVNGFTAPIGGTVSVPNDFSDIGYGAFLHRDADGIGNVNYTNVKLLWDYGISGVADDAIIEICVLAVEMVYIPGGSFEVGDDGTDVKGNFEAGISTNPFLITSENALTLGGSSSANLNNNNAFGMGIVDDFNDATTQALPATFPKGTLPFYIMKYEISQGQYAAFLNKLSSAASINRFPSQNGSSNHTIDNTGVPPNTYVASSPDRACNFLGWADVAAYADWSGLRPMTELEFEKACRGTLAAGVDECAWGSPFAFNQQYTVANSGQPSEIISNMGIGTGNANYSTTHPAVNGPRRCGIFSGSLADPSRAESGATYYGVMEMSGNIWEITVSVGSPEGRAFTPNHGNGIIGSSTGNSTVSGWPAYTGGSSGVGIGLRGGGFSNPLADINISTRRLATFTIASRFSDVGGRLVRSGF